jgi:hypothetical protein
MIPALTSHFGDRRMSGGARTGAASRPPIPPRSTTQTGDPAFRGRLGRRRHGRPEFGDGRANRSPALP